MTPASHNILLGRYGERIALQHLVEVGMILLERNWRCSAGELDLILRDGDTLVVCEVKTRRDERCGHPLEAIGPTKSARLHQLAALWQEARRVRPPEVRLDAVGVLLPHDGRACVDHVRGIG